MKKHKKSVVVQEDNDDEDLDDEEDTDADGGRATDIPYPSHAVHGLLCQLCLYRAIPRRCAVIRRVARVECSYGEDRQANQLLGHATFQHVLDESRIARSIELRHIGSSAHSG